MQVGFPQKSTFSTLTANEIICPKYDSAGVNVNFYRDGVLHLKLVGTKLAFYKDLQMQAGAGLKDNIGSIIIGLDDAGHIDDLARIDAAVKTPAGSHSVYLSAGEIVSLGQAALINEASGIWEANANDEFYGWLNTALHRLAIQGKVYIDTIKMFLSTGHANDYASNLRLHRRLLTDSARVAVANNPANFGATTTGNVTAEVTVGHELLANNVYTIQVSCIIPDVDVKIYGIEILYHMV